MQTADAVVDVALFSTGDIGLVEFNPMQLEQVGLFACDATALVKMF
jgi:hypothetical protein